MGLYPTYPIRTARLALRPLVPADADDVLGYQGDSDAVRFVPYGPQTREQVLERIATRPATIDEPPGAISLGIELVATGRVIGDAVLMWHSAEHRTGEIGYILNTAYTGQGFATEAAGAMLRLGFDELGLHRIAARIDARNSASVAVAQRLGMRQEAVLRENEWFKGEWSDEIVFALLESEWPRER